MGLAIGGALVWFAIGRLPRSSEEIPADELKTEAAWISETINGRGGLAPEDLVEEVLELHVEYLDRQSENRLALALPTSRRVDPDHAADGIRHGGGDGADDHLAQTAEQQAPTSDQADCRAHGE